MDAFELLKNDHKKVSEIFEEIESASGKAKTQLFTRLKSELDLHAHIEEKFLYPALENKEEARDITLEAYEEHKVVKDLLAELATDRTPEDEWDAKLKVLRENVEHHVEEEEGELFDKAEDVLTAEQIERLGNEMEAEKARQSGGASKPARAAQERQSRSAKSISGSKKTEGPGVLKRLASLVGLGSAAESKKKPKARGARAPSTTKASSEGKSGTTTKTSKKTAGKTRRAGKAEPKASAKRTPARKANLRSASSKSTKGRRQVRRGRAK
jgi:hypothetical protein